MTQECMTQECVLDVKRRTKREKRIMADGHDRAIRRLPLLCIAIPLIIARRL